MDPVFQPLLAALDQAPDPVVWLADESNAGVLSTLVARKDDVLFISNRFDIATKASQCGLNARFSDFDLSSINPGGGASEATPNASTAFYRISKERPLTHYVINEVFRRLPLGGSLWLTGRKDEGIKSYYNHASRLFSDASRLKKAGNSYCAQLIKNREPGDSVPYLQDQDYEQLRWIAPPDADGFYSKPGTYGWDKVDSGSRFLLEQVPTLLRDSSPESGEFLDLGCGYGYLTFNCRHLPFRSFTATDNNAAAIRCAHANTAHYQMPASVIADDCGANLSQQYSLILCNPPFHQGFNIESSLTDKFVGAVQRLLAPGGVAGLVVNSFIPLEAKAEKLLPTRRFRSEVIANNGRFKVLRIQRRD